MGESMSVAEDDIPSVAEKQPIKTETSGETSELKQKRIDSIHNSESQMLTHKILAEKTKDMVPLPTPTDYQKDARKYKWIVSLLNEKDGVTPYDEQYPNYIPLNIDRRDPPWVKMVDGQWLPARYSDDGALQVTQIREKHGEQIVCTAIDNKKNQSDITIRILDLADAQMDQMLKISDSEKANIFQKEERDIIEARLAYTTKNDISKINELYKNPQMLWNEAKKHKLVTTESIKSFFDITYREIVPKDGEELTVDQELDNHSLQIRKKELIDMMNLDARIILDENILAGITTATSTDTVRNLEKLMGQQTDPDQRELFQKMISYINDNKVKVTEGIPDLMKDMTPEVAQKINDSFSKGDLAGVYAEIIKKYPGAAEKLDEWKSAFGEKALLAGGGILIAILIAVLNGAMSQGLKGQR